MIKTKISATGQDWEMLEPKDLRIGNILLYKGKYVHVTNLSLDIDDEYQDIIGFCELGKTSNEHSDWNRVMPELNPVPLAHEILERCGLKVDQYEGEDGCIVYRDGKMYGVYYQKKKYLTLDELRISRRYYYLHEFQNLYFSLTGKELIVKL